VTTATVGPVDVASGVEIGEGTVLEGMPGREVVVEAGVRIGRGCRIGPGVRLGAGSVVGDHVILGHPSKAELTGTDASAVSPRVRDKVVAEAWTLIGADAIIRSHSIVYSHVVIDRGFRGGHHILVREHTRIGAGCVFGSYASCDGYTAIGAAAHIGQYVMLAQAATLGRAVFVGGHTTFSDNRWMVRDPADDLFGAVVEDGARVGLSCVILPAVRVGRDAVLGAGAVVSEDIPAATLAYGVPARVVRSLSAEEVARYRAALPADVMEEETSR
jgi:acetyltransferase-like isoleucine patch superfamily enzyme